MPLHNEDEIGRPVSGTKIAEIVAPGITALAQIKRLFVTMFATIRSLTVGTVNASSPGPGNLRVQNDIVTNKLHVQNDAIIGHDATVEGNLTVGGQIIVPTIPPGHRAYFTFTHENEIINTVRMLKSGTHDFGGNTWPEELHLIPMIRPGVITGLSASMVSVDEGVTGQSVRFSAGYSRPPPYRGEETGENPAGIPVEGGQAGDSGWAGTPNTSLSVRLNVRPAHRLVAPFWHHFGQSENEGYPDGLADYYGRTSNWITIPMPDTINYTWASGNAFRAGAYIGVTYKPPPHGQQWPTIKQVIAVVEVTYIT